MLETGITNLSVALTIAYCKPQGMNKFIVRVLVILNPMMNPSVIGYSFLIIIFYDQLQWTFNRAYNKPMFFCFKLKGAKPLSLTLQSFALIKTKLFFGLLKPK